MRQFPLYNSHIDLAHGLWNEILSTGGFAIDATCGNGHDSLFLAKELSKAGGGSLLMIDIQEAAIVATKKRLEETNIENVNYLFEKRSHSPITPLPGIPKLIVYNLGYLPSGDKNLTTKTETTLSSINSSLENLSPGGVISITCYPGHDEGAKEESLLLDTFSTLDPAIWVITHKRFLNRVKSPSVIILQKSM